LETTLLLFDIDGTLLTSGGCGERALRAAVKEFFGKDDDLQEIEIAGRTDTSIARQLLRKYAGDESRAMDVLEHYLRHLPGLLPERPGRLLPGVSELLAALHARPDVVLALLTGNLHRGAEYKLRHYGVWHYFQFGAFADDHHDRNELGAVALQRARERGIEARLERVFVIGDTPHDIACARACGARAVGVATGGSSYEALSAMGADAVLRDFTDLPAVLRVFGLA
jgi:phosphoglycolate phosphatase-like HAD superfamily hydrolase